MPLPTAIDLSFDGFDQLGEAVAAWNLEVTVLDRGPLSSRLVQGSIGDTLVSWGQFSRATEQQAISPEGMVTLCFATTTHEPYHWNGMTVAPDSFMLMPGGTSFCSTAKAGFSVTTLSLPESGFLAAAQDAGQSDLSDQLAEGREILVEGRITMIRAMGHAAVAQVAAKAGQPGANVNPDLGDALLEHALLATSRSDNSSTIGTRERVYRRALAYCATRQPADWPLRVTDLCRAACASQATLERAFRERLGVTPKQYLQARRLNEVRRSLLRTQVPVAAAAQLWGFRHLGQFAADYRALFAELPSQTRASST